VRRHTKLDLCWTAAAVALCAAIASAEPPAAIDRSGPPTRESLALLRAKYARPGAPPYPAGNAWSAAREELGRTLFFDPRLSRSGVMSCATCHNPGFSWGDGLARGVGHAAKALPRRSPTLLNVAWAEALFWDGRAGTLEEQALGPIASPDEMNLPLEELVPRIQAVAGYAPLFERAYPGEGIGTSTIAKAIATFERSLVSGSAPFDRWLEGDASAISEEAARGFVLFNEKAKCAACHSGWRFTDDSFHDIGAPGKDRGRAAVLEGIQAMEYAFKTPTLRDVDRRGPYLHDGSEPTLESVVELYDLGGRVKRPSLSPEIVPLSLTKNEARAIVAFMQTLTSEDAPVAMPRLPR
jgi:cytochrome c peroxidase